MMTIDQPSGSPPPADQPPPAVAAPPAPAPQPPPPAQRLAPQRPPPPRRPPATSRKLIGVLFIAGGALFALMLVALLVSKSDDVEEDGPRVGIVQIKGI